MKSEKCPVCTIARLNGEFRWSNTGAVAHPDAVFSRVCRHAKKEGCINSAGKYNKNKDYITPEDLDTKIKDYLDR